MFYWKNKQTNQDCLNRRQIFSIVMLVFFLNHHFPKDLSIKSTRQNTKKDKSKIIPLVHGTQPMKRSTPRSTQSICLPDTRWRKTLLQTQSDVIPQFNLSEKHIGGLILLYICVPSAGRTPLSNSIVLIYISIHIYFLQSIQQYLFYFDKRIVSQTGVHIETILFIFNTGFIPV